MKKRLLKKLRDSRPVNYGHTFWGFADRFFYLRLAFALFIFILYLSFAIDDTKKSILVPGVNDLFLFGILFAWIAYTSTFNLLRALFCLFDGAYPLYFGEVDLLNGWLRFDYSRWESIRANHSGYFITLFFDSVVFFASMLLIKSVTMMIIMG